MKAGGVHLWACVSRAICSPLSLLLELLSDRAVFSESWTRASLFFSTCSLKPEGWDQRTRNKHQFFFFINKHIKIWIIQGIIGIKGMLNVLKFEKLHSSQLLHQILLLSDVTQLMGATLLFRETVHPNLKCHPSPTRPDVGRSSGDIFEFMNQAKEFHPMDAKDSCLETAMLTPCFWQQKISTVASETGATLMFWWSEEYGKFR